MISLNPGTSTLATCWLTDETIVESSAVKKPIARFQQCVVKCVAPVQHIVAQDALAGLQASAQDKIRALAQDLTQGRDGLPSQWVVTPDDMLSAAGVAHVELSTRPPENRS